MTINICDFEQHKLFNEHLSISRLIIYIGKIWIIKFHYLQIRQIIK